MKIQLPRENIILSEEKGEIRDGILYLHRNMFEEAMFELTYLLYGHVCHYCGKPITDISYSKEKRKGILKNSLDHLIPREFGGPSITNNLRPCCSGCNMKKGNMFPDEFRVFQEILKMKNHREQKLSLKKFFSELDFIQEKRRYGEVQSLPDEWLEEPMKSVYVNFRLEDPIGTVFQKISQFYKKYKRIPYPIVVSGNKYLLDGFNSILFMKIERITRIETIKLENVIYDGLEMYTAHILSD